MNQKLWKAPRNVALIIVNYNNEVEVGDVVNNAKQHFDPNQIIFVDDGSQDTSAEIAEKAGIEVHKHASNMGVGAAIRTGIDISRKTPGMDYALIIASNGKMSPAEGKRLIDRLESGADFVQGSRYLPEGGSPDLTLFRSILIPLASFVLSLLLFRRLTDVSCGYRGFRLSLFDDKRINLHQAWLDRYELESYLLFKACRLGYRVVEAPVTMTYSHLQKARISKIRPGVDYWKILRPYLVLFAGLRR